MSGDTTKDFAPIQDAYAFFEEHATEAAADVAAYLPHVRPLADAGRPVRLLDFGCGSGRFSARFLTAAGFAPDHLHLSLVEPVDDYRRQAAADLRAFTAHPVEAWPALPADRAGAFDLIVANHCLYYTPDLEGTLAGLLGARAAGGLFLAACAGRRNRLIGFWERGYALLGRPVPHHTGDAVAAALGRLGAAFAVRDVHYELAFADTEANRELVLRFLFGADYPALPRAEALAFFDPFAAGGRVRVDVVHEQFAVRAGLSDPLPLGERGQKFGPSPPPAGGVSSPHPRLTPRRTRPMFAPLALAAAVLAADPAPAPKFTTTEDVIYGRKYALALTMDVYTPAKPNGRGVIFCVSGGWFSAKGPMNGTFVKPLLDRGYTVFAVLHGSQPKFAIPEVLEDMHRAVRFIRANGKKFGVDPDKLGITGGSAGGHLSLMMGTTGKPGDPAAKDPVDREPSKVAAVGCFFPPTDFLNYSKPGQSAVGVGVLDGFRPPFDFKERDPKTGVFVSIPDGEKRDAIGKQISPAQRVTADAAPALIVHGDADKLVPLQQAEVYAAAAKAAGVPCEIIVKPGAAHGWPGMDKDMTAIADWFDKYLLK